MTKASVGSHAPMTSRKASTRAGLIMSDMASPAPKSVPVIKAVTRLRIASASRQVAGDADDGEAGAHERRCRRERARRQPSHAAHPMPTGAAVAETGAEADEQPGDDQQRDR